MGNSAKGYILSADTAALALEIWRHEKLAHPGIKKAIARQELGLGETHPPLHQVSGCRVVHSIQVYCADRATHREKWHGLNT